MIEPDHQRIYSGPAQWTHWLAISHAVADVTKELGGQARHVAEFVLEEWFVNLCTHGQIQARRVLQAKVYWRAIGQGWELVLVDDGQPFDPTRQPAPDIRAPLDKRGPGGMGIHLMLKMTQTARYDRHGHLNALRLSWHPN